MTRAAVFEGFDAARAGDAGFHVVMVGPDATPDDVQAFRDAYELGLAWHEAMRLLPEGGEMMVGSDLANPPERRYEAEAYPRVRHEGPDGYEWEGVPFQTQEGCGPTPAAALRALAARLREGK